MVERAGEHRWNLATISLPDSLAPVLKAYCDLPSILDLEDPIAEFRTLIGFERDEARQYDTIVSNRVWELSQARNYSQAVSYALTEFVEMEKAGFLFHDLRALRIRHCRRTARTYMAWGEEGSTDPVYQAARFGFALSYYALSDLEVGRKTGACFGVVDSLAALGLEEESLALLQGFFGEGQQIALANPKQVSAILAQASRVHTLPGITLASFGKNGPDGKKILN